MEKPRRESLKNAVIPPGDRTVERGTRLPIMDDASATMTGSSTNDRGSNAIGLAVAGVIVAFFAVMPFVILVALYLFLTIYAIVRAIGPGAGENTVTILVGFALITSTFATLLGVAIHLIGRSLTPKRRRASS